MDYQNSSYMGKNNAVHNTTNKKRRENGVTISTVVLTSMSSAANGRTTLISRLAALALFWALCWAFHSRCFWRRMDSSSAVPRLFSASSLRCTLRTPQSCRLSGVPQHHCLLMMVLPGLLLFRQCLQGNNPCWKMDI